ncbi:sugar phosphate isomerase/epimerase family protein [Roseibium polysiphoniae]|uniref:Sugar phosphate isomerase/epimerase n=1 Tax=Roseibium polysiphoniae TaxID=2571221 RepID=A0ABR9CEG2_9HYPH|nr:sugar phosphate isomerase/epimerase [Roseibium polysiphoniae]MBD8878268.1 sugar phosphate isomerase/epimerase [Roseibium polysiphoniae]
MTDKICIGSGLNTNFLAAGDAAGLDALLGQYKTYDQSHVEITARRLDVIVGGRIIEERAGVMQVVLEAHALKYVLHADHAINFMDLPNFDVHWALAEASVELCRRYGMTSMVMHSGNVPVSVWLDSRDQLLEFERESLKRLGDLAAEAGVQIAVENLIADPLGNKVVSGADPRRLAEQLAKADHPAIGGCLDFGHAFLSAPVENFDFLEAIKTFSEQVWHLHLHDNFGRPDLKGYADEGSRVSLGIGDLHLPMGWGSIDWTSVLPAMKFRKNTYAMIELRGRYRAVEDQVAATAKAFMDYWNDDLPLAGALTAVRSPEKK